MPSYSLALDYLDFIDKISPTTLVFENSPQKRILSAKKRLWLSWTFTAWFYSQGICGGYYSFRHLLLSIKQIRSIHSKSERLC